MTGTGHIEGRMDDDMNLTFTKMHGAGNDYVYVDGRNRKEDWPEISRKISDRHLGVGSDGLILALSSTKADIRMQMFNADGSEGEMCGNGIRCLVGFAFDNNIVPRGTHTISVETLAGIKEVTPFFEGEHMTRAKVLMGKPIFRAKDIPVEIPGQDIVTAYPLEVDGYVFNIHCVSMGNPHAVAFIEQSVDDFPLQTIGPDIENHKFFPRKTNFEVVNVLSRAHIKVRVWERGSGQTLACGTGACAAAVISQRQGITDNPTTVSLPGGNLVVTLSKTGEVVLDGPVARVFEGQWEY